MSVVVSCNNIVPKVFPKNVDLSTREEKMNRNMDWGIMSMIIFDLEPFNLVNRYFILLC